MNNSSDSLESIDTGGTDHSSVKSFSEDEIQLSIQATKLPRKKTPKKMESLETSESTNKMCCKDKTMRRSSSVSTQELKFSNIPTIRENIASKKRFELKHNICEEYAHSVNDYATPLQRKDQEVRELKFQLKETQKGLEQKDTWCRDIERKKDEQHKNEIEEKVIQIEGLTSEVNDLKLQQQETAKYLEEAAQTIQSLKSEVQTLQDQIETKERQHQQLYLEMYTRGKKAALFERREEIERLARANPQSVTIKELIEKLVVTESELEKWQNIKRDELYHTTPKPETDAEVVLPFLKDAMFHYLTDDKGNEQHLRAIIQIFRYTDIQMKRIHTATTDKKSKQKN